MCLISPLGLESSEIFLERILPEYVIPGTSYWGHMISARSINNGDNFDHLVNLALARFLYCKGNVSSFLTNKKYVG